MAEIVWGQAFGNRTGYTPAAEDSAYDEYRARLDAQYLEANADEVNIVMRYVRSVSEELSVTIAMLRESGNGRRYSNIPPDLHELCLELYRYHKAVQGNVSYYAGLVMEIDDRITNAQRYIVEHAAR